MRTRKHLALLLILGHRPGRHVPRDRVMELLWSEDGEKAARHSLSQSVSLVNKAAGEDLVVAEGSTQLLVPRDALRTDVADFETLAKEGRYDEARALWHGTLLDGLYVRRAPAFERWLSDERGRLERQMRRMAADLIERRRQDGDHAGMRAEAEALLALDPLDEAAMLACVQALTLGGERTLALRRYGEFERRLKAELDAEPGSALRGWAKRQRRGETDAVRVPVVSRVHEVQALPAAQPLFGRVEEYRALWETWEKATTGEGTFWILEGEAGIGKTALAGKLANQVHVSGASVCFVACYRTEKSVPFAPISALIRQLARLPGFVAMNPSWIGELTRLVPELKDRFPNVPPPMGVDDSARFRLVDATVHATECVADEQPLLIVVDDIHDADEATLATLHYLGRQVRAWPALVVATSRIVDEASELQRTFFQTARSNGLAHFLEMRPLDESSVAKLVAQVVASMGVERVKDDVERVVEAAHGNPLLAIEAALGKDGSSRSPRSASNSFDQVLVARLQTLSTHAQEVAGALALVGRPLTFPSIAEVTSIAASALIGALEELEAASFVIKKGAAYALIHEKYQAAIDHNTPSRTRADLHSRIATLKAKTDGAGKTGGIEIARHYALAGRNRRAVRHALAAAHYAKSLGAVRERATALELASALAGRHADQLLELADCYLDLKEFGLVASLCDEIIANPKATSVNRLEASFLRTSAAHQSGDILLADAGAALEKLLESGEDFPHRMRAYFQLVRATDKSGDPVRARQHAKALRRTSSTTAARNGKGYGILATSYVISRYGDPRRALASLRNALQEAQRVNDWELETVVRSGFGAVLKQVGRFADSVQSIQDGLEFARKTLNPLAEATALNDLAVTEIALGRHADAAEHLAEAARIDAAYPRWPLRAYRMSNQGVLHYHVGNIDAARTALRIAFDFAREHDVWAIQICTRGMLGMCAVRQHLDADLAVHAHWLEAELPPRRKMVPDLGPTDATLAWFQAKDGDPKGASVRLEQRCRYLRRRDVDHWMFATLELIRLRERFGGQRLTAERKALHTAAAGFGATAVARLAADVSS